MELQSVSDDIAVSTWTMLLLSQIIFQDFLEQSGKNRYFMILGTLLHEPGTQQGKCATLKIYTSSASDDQEQVRLFKFYFLELSKLYFSAIKFYLLQLSHKIALSTKLHKTRPG